MRTMLAILCCVGLVPAVARAQQSTPAAAPACAHTAGASAADSTAPIPAERRLTVPDPMRDVRPADSLARPVTLRFLVAANGRVPPWTIAVDGTTDRRWLIHARRWMARARFKPALRGNCAVPQWMVLTYDYAGKQAQPRETNGP